MAVNETKRKRIVYVIFVLAVIWGLYNQPWKRPERDSAPVKSTTPTEAAAQVAASAARTAAPDRQNTTEAPGWTVDPFRPLESQDDIAVPVDVSPDSPVPALQGTMTVGSRQLCVLDGRVHRVGDRVGIWKIADISAGRVTLASTEGEILKLSTGKTDL